MSLTCLVKNCDFESQPFELYQTHPETNQPMTNVAASIAMTKCDLSPKSINLLCITMNVCSPPIRSLQKGYTFAASYGPTLAKEALKENRKIVTEMMELKGECSVGEPPKIDVVEDGNYNIRSDREMRLID